jgi:non-heme chloroperoxidase
MAGICWPARHSYADLEFVAVEGGPHDIASTHADEVNTALLAFLAK